MYKESNDIYSAYHYRTSSRFGGIVNVVLSGKGLTITGTRISPFIYKAWIILQSFILFLTIPAIIVPIVLGRPIYILLLLVVIFIHNSIGGIGATALWEYNKVDDFSNKRKGQEVLLPFKDIKDVRLGKGWERKGLWFVIPYVIPLINMTTKDLCVSFEAYDPTTGKDVVYALLFNDKKKAEQFSERISS